jgi:uncharacterized protein (DUF302 family)
MFFEGCTQTPPLQQPLKRAQQQDIQVISLHDANRKINAQTIEDAFQNSGLNVLGNNDMNKPFQARFKTTHYKQYNLAMYMDNELSFRLIKKYPSFGALTPLTMSIYRTGTTINIATLTRFAMARAAQIPVNDPDLIAYSALITKALKNALPNGHFQKLAYSTPKPTQSYQVNFTAQTQLDDGNNWDDYIEDFEAEFEAEMEPYGFLFPNFMDLKEELFAPHNYHKYDFYHTYSICKFDVIFPVSKLHPEAGAWAPCSFYIYKLKNENTMHMGFLGVENWIKTLDIKDKESIEPLRQAQDMIIKTLNEITQ